MLDYGLEFTKQGHRKWLNEKDIKIYEGMPETYHEVINSCRLYLDLDVKPDKKSKENSEKFIVLLVEHFNDFFKSLIKYDIEASQTILEIEKKNYVENPLIYIMSETDDKLKITCNTKTETEFFIAKCTETNNYHIYIDFYFYDLKRFNIELAIKKIYYQCEDPREQIFIWTKFKEFLQDKIDFKLDFIDMAVYRPNAQLRSVYSPKYGEKRYYKPYSIMKNDKPLPILKNLNILFSSFRGSSNLKNSTFDINFINAKFDELPETITKERLKYEQLAFEDIIKNSQLNIDKFLIWRKAVYRIYCFYSFLPVEQRKEIIINFCSARGWGAEAHKKENIELVDSLAKRNISFYFSLSSLQDFFGCIGFIKGINTSEVQYPDIKPNSVFCIKSGCGTKKTRNFFEKFGDKTILYISYRCALSLNICNDYQVKSYEDYKNVNIDEEECPQKLACQINSLYKFINWIDNFEYIFLDECEAIWPMFKFIVDEAKNPSIVQSLTTIIFKKFFKEKKVVCASANLGFKTFYILELFKANISGSLINYYKDKEDYKFLFFGTEKKLKEEIYILCSEGKRFVICTNSATEAEVYKNFLSNYINADRILCLTKEIRDKDSEKINNILRKVDEEFIKYDVVIYSPVIEAGVSFNVKNHFDCIIGVFDSKSVNHQSAFQMLFRVRYPTEKKILFHYTKPKHINKVNETSEQILNNSLNKRNYSKKKYDKINFNDKCFEKVSNIELLDKYNKTIVFCYWFNSYSSANFYRLLKLDLLETGIQWIEIESDFIPLTVAEKKDRRDIINKIQEEKLLNYNEKFFDLRKYGIIANDVNVKIINNNLINNNFNKTIEILLNYLNLENLFFNRPTQLYNLITYFKKNKVEDKDFNKYIIPLLLQFNVIDENYLNQKYIDRLVKHINETKLGPEDMQKTIDFILNFFGLDVIKENRVKKTTRLLNYFKENNVFVEHFERTILFSVNYFKLDIETDNKEELIFKLSQNILNSSMNDSEIKKIMFPCLEFFNIKKLENDKVACMYKFIEFFKENNIKEDSLDIHLRAFFKQKTDTMNLAFKISAQKLKTKEEYLKVAVNKKDDTKETKAENEKLNKKYKAGRLQAINLRLADLGLKLQDNNSIMKIEIKDENSSLFQQLTSNRDSYYIDFIMQR